MVDDRKPWFWMGASVFPQGAEDQRSHSWCTETPTIHYTCGGCGKSWSDKGQGRYDMKAKCPHCEIELRLFTPLMNETQVFDAVSGRSLGPSD